MSNFEIVPLNITKSSNLMDIYKELPPDFILNKQIHEIFSLALDTTDKEGFTFPQYAELVKKYNLKNTAFNKQRDYLEDLFAFMMVKFFNNDWKKNNEFLEEFESFRKEKETNV